MASATGVCWPPSHLPSWASAHPTGSVACRLPPSRRCPRGGSATPHPASFGRSGVHRPRLRLDDMGLRLHSAGRGPGESRHGATAGCTHCWEAREATSVSVHVHSEVVGDLRGCTAARLRAQGRGGRSGCSTLRSRLPTSPPPLCDTDHRMLFNSGRGDAVGGGGPLTTRDMRVRQHLTVLPCGSRKGHRHQRRQLVTADAHAGLSRGSSNAMLRSVIARAMARA